MTRDEWLSIGYDKNIIDMDNYAQVLFSDAYRKWFLMKIGSIRGQSCDRIEATWNLYYAGHSISGMYVSQIAETDIIGFLNECIRKKGGMTYKEFGRCIQIVRDVLFYMRDMGVGGVRLYDWGRIRRCLALAKPGSTPGGGCAVSMDDVQKVLDAVLFDNVYPLKRSACLCLCMNFYLGLRLGELAGLSFGDFDFDRGVVHIHRTQSKSFDRDSDGVRVGSTVYRVVDCCKTVNSVRDVPLMDETKYIYQMISRHHIERGYDSPYLAYDGTDTILYKSLDRTLRRLCVLCGVPYFNSHMIRKTFVTMLHYSGVPTKVISGLVGHSDISTTERNYILSLRDNDGYVLTCMKNGIKYNLK